MSRILKHKTVESKGTGVTGLKVLGSSLDADVELEDVTDGGGSKNGKKKRFAKLGKHLGFFLVEFGLRPLQLPW